MISGKVLIECGDGSVESAAAVNPVDGAGLVFMRSTMPQEIGTTNMSKEEFEALMDNAEVMLCFRNIESLDVFISNFTQLRERMIEEREQLNKEARDE